MKYAAASLTGAIASVLAFATLADTTTLSFTALDKDRDGQVSASEAAAHDGLDPSFATADADGDGSVSQSEFDTWQSESKPGRTRTAEASPSASEPSSVGSRSSPSSEMPSSSSSTTGSSSASDTTSSSDVRTPPEQGDATAGSDPSRTPDADREPATPKT
jgi:hypothetical protein